MDFTRSFHSIFFLLKSLMCLEKIFFYRKWKICSFEFFKDLFARFWEFWIVHKRQASKRLKWSSSKSGLTKQPQFSTLLQKACWHIFFVLNAQHSCNNKTDILTTLTWRKSRNSYSYCNQRRRNSKKDVLEGKFYSIFWWNNDINGLFIQVSFI